MNDREHVEMEGPQHSAKDPNVEYDLVVIGGGINGSGVARDASGRGLNVLLCEKDDLAAHTSSSSTKLIHGGLRYLEHYDFSLVRQALKEREVLLGIAPHIIWPLRFILPHHSALRPRWLLRAGLFLYDHIGGRKLLPKSRGVNLARHTAGAPLKKEFSHAFEYSDCWVQDARLVVLNARDAANHGATVLTRTECVQLDRKDNYWEITLKNSRTGTLEKTTAAAVVNASGPWVEKTLGLYSTQSSKRSIRHVKGSHVVVKKLFNHDYPYIFQHHDGRILFAIPFEQDFTLLGTTDLDFQGDLDQVSINDAEIDYICAAVSDYFQQPINKNQVVWSYSGVRPLFNDASDNISKISREHELHLDTQGAPIVSVYGGKITTYRKLGEEVMDLLQPILDCEDDPWTGASPLPGGDIVNGDFARFLAECEHHYGWLDRAIVIDYCRNYGLDIHTILEDCHQKDDLGAYFGGGLYACEVAYLVEHEWAETTDDILWRRSKKGLKLDTAAVEQLANWLRSLDNGLAKR